MAYSFDMAYSFHMSATQSTQKGPVLSVLYLTQLALYTCSSVAQMSFHFIFHLFSQSHLNSFLVASALVLNHISGGPKKGLVGGPKENSGFTHMDMSP